ncbi:MAG: spermine synthase [Candidatus Brocadiia bacterium]
MLPFALILIGFSGIVAQLLLLRELLIVFMGNELSIGVILADWLILGAVGAYLLGRIINRVERKTAAYVIAQLLFALALPLSVYLARDIRLLSGAMAGVGFGFLEITYWSFLILLPVSVLNGMMFTFGCRIYSLAKPDSNVGNVYILETIGAIAGGLAFTYLFTPYLHSFQTAIVISSLNLFSGLILIGLPQACPNDCSVERGYKEYKIISFCVLCAFVVSNILLFGSGADRMHWDSIKRQWQPLNVVDYRNSHYGNLVVTKEEGQYTFFSNGLPAITTPVPDVGHVEDFVHLPMLAHPEPKDILVLSGGAGGVINEILKHPSVRRIDYAEIDPMLFELLRKYPTPLSQSELDNPKVHVHNVDGRLFLQQTSQQYDMIFIGVSNPSDLQINRLFTMEFFELARKRINSGGLLVFVLPGSESYLSEELKKLNGCVLLIFEAERHFYYVIPGNMNLFLIPEVGSENRITSEVLIKRLEQRKLHLGYISPGYIEYRMDENKVRWFRDNINNVSYNSNRDFLPSAVIYSIGYWNAMFAPEFQKWFRHVEEISFSFIVLIIAILTILISLLLRSRKGASRMAIPIVLVSTGFAGMVVNLMLIFAFQVVFGYVFHQIGLMVTAFMVGIAAGGFVMTFYMDKIKWHFQAMIIIEIMLIIFSIVLPRLQDVQNGVAGQAIFLLCAGMVGIVIGAEFPLAIRLYSGRAKEGNSSGAAGLLYGADLLGGWLGGMVGGVVLLPVIGFINTIMVIVVIKVGSIIVLISARDRA